HSVLRTDSLRIPDHYKDHDHNHQEASQEAQEEHHHYGLGKHRWHLEPQINSANQKTRPPDLGGFCLPTWFRPPSAGTVRGLHKYSSCDFPVDDFPSKDRTFGSPSPCPAEGGRNHAGKNCYPLRFPCRE